MRKPSWRVLLSDESDLSAYLKSLKSWTLAIRIQESWFSERQGSKRDWFKWYLDRSSKVHGAIGIATNMHVVMQIESKLNVSYVNVWRISRKDTSYTRSLKPSTWKSGLWDWASGIRWLGHGPPPPNDVVQSVGRLSWVSLRIDQQSGH